MNRYIHTLSIIILLLSLNSCKNSTEKSKIEKIESTNKKVLSNHKVTFIELGSVRCIPCQKMQPIIKSIEEKYSDQVEIIFYDVWTPEGKEKAKDFVFDVIPTQLFLDSDGKEYFRHVGYFPEDEVEKILMKKGVIKTTDHEN